MSEESKTAEGDYVMMGAGSGAKASAAAASSGGAGGKVKLNWDDPNISQEEKDHRLAIAMQQQENAAAYNEHKKKHEEQVKAKTNRTTRSGAFTGLAAVRAKDHGMLSVPSEYSSEHAYKNADNEFQPEFTIPASGSKQEIEDAKLASELQKVEQVDAGTVRTMQKMVQEEEETEEAQAHRTTLSKFTL